MVARRGAIRRRFSRWSLRAGASGSIPGSRRRHHLRCERRRCWRRWRRRHGWCRGAGRDRVDPEGSEAARRPLPTLPGATPVRRAATGRRARRPRRARRRWCGGATAGGPRPGVGAAPSAYVAVRAAGAEVPARAAGGVVSAAGGVLAGRHLQPSLDGGQCSLELAVVRGHEQRPSVLLGRALQVAELFPRLCQVAARLDVVRCVPQRALELDPGARGVPEVSSARPSVSRADGYAGFTARPARATRIASVSSPLLRSSSASWANRRDPGSRSSRLRSSSIRVSATVQNASGPAPVGRPRLRAARPAGAHHCWMMVNGLRKPQLLSRRHRNRRSHRSR